jgi:integrase
MAGARTISGADPLIAWDCAALARASRAPATWAAYASDMQDFEQWCASVGVACLPAAPDTIGRYLADRARTLKPSTLERRVAAIVVHHRQHGHAIDARHPAIADVLGGLRRLLGTAPNQKAALTAEDLRVIVAALPTTLAGIRDKACLLVGFALAARRGEIAALQMADLLPTSEGWVVTVPRRKEDQEGAGALKAIPFGADPLCCPARSLRQWVLQARLDDGPVFRQIDRHGNLGDGLTGKSIAAIVKRAVETAGRKERWTEAEIAARVASVAGHSLRSGFITSAAHAEVPVWEIMQHTGHSRPDTLRRYIRKGGLFQRNLITRVGL